MNHKITHKPFQGLRGHGAKPHNITRRITVSCILFLVCAMAVPAITAQLADTPWPMFHHDLNHTGLSSNYGPDTSTLKWTFSTGDMIFGSAAIAEDGTIYVGTRDRYPWTNSKLYAVYPNGTVKWHWTPPTGKFDFIDSTPAVASDGTIYVGSWNRRLYALNPDGTQKWEFYVTSPCKKRVGFVLTSPAIAPDGTIYTGNNNRKLYAIYPNGTEKWHYTTGGAIQSSPAVGLDGTVYVGTWDNKLYAINPDGTLKWKYSTCWAIQSSPAIGSDGTIYVGSNDRKLYAINPDGTLKWSYSTCGKVKSSPAIGADGIIYVGSNDNKLYAIYPNNGTLKWSYSTCGKVKSSPAIDADGTVYVGSKDKHVYAINPNGTLLWKYYTGNRIYYSSPAIASDGTVHIGNRDGKLYAFGPGQVPCVPSIDVNKTVWDTAAGAWVEAIHGANINQTYRFRCEVHNNGSCCDLTDIKVVDNLSDSLEYVNNATVDGVPHEPDWQTGNQFGWNFTGPLVPSQKIVIEFDANVTGCGNDSNVQNATAYCADTDEWVSDRDEAGVNVSDGTVCGHGSWEDDPGNSCQERRVIHKCVSGSCTPSCEYEYQNKPDGTDCGSDYHDAFVNYCKGDEVWKHRLFHDFYCEAGTCMDHTSWVDDTFVENCNLKDGWYNTTNTRWVNDTECTEKEQQEQEYRDYTCSGGVCTFSVTNTQWIDTGAVMNKPDGTDCGSDYHDSYANYCKGDEVWKHRLFHDFYCEAGICADNTSWVDDTFVENCNLKDGWYNTTNTRWVNDTECTEKEQQEQEYRDYTCSGGVCTFSVTNTQWIDTGAVMNKPDGTDCGSDYHDSYANYCKGDEVWKHRLFHDFYCEAGTCMDHTSWVDDTFVENCNLKDGWYNTTNTRWVNDTECTEKEQQEQEYRDYTCSGGVCTFSVTNTQWIDTGAVMNKPDGTDCGSDYHDSYANYCKGDEVWKHRLFHDFYCEAGICADNTSWVDDTFVENCNLKDGWYNTTNTRWVNDTECTEKEQQEQEYRDYTCSGGGVCTFSVTNTQWIDTGAVVNKPDGTDCGSDYHDSYANYCKGDEVWKHRQFHDFYCEAGICADNTSWVDDTFVENCNLKDGWYNTTNTRWVNDTECTEKEQQEQEYGDYTCSGGGVCTFSVTNTQWIDTGAVVNKPDGTDCGSDYHDSYANYCKGDEVWKHRLFHDFYCEAGICADNTSWVDDTFVENCNLKDGWYNTTNTRWVNDTECTEKEQQEQEYGDYTCSGGGVCTFSVTNTQWIDTGAVVNKPDGTDCGSDYHDSYANYCKGDEVWKHRLFHDFYCEAGICADNTSWVDDTFVENCNLKDGWYNTTNTRWVNDTECTEKEQQEQEYRDYTCSGGVCTFSVTNTQWIDTGAVMNKSDGTDCGYGSWEDDPENPSRERRVIYKCVSGTCTLDGYEYRPKGISIAVEPELTNVQPQDQFDVNVTVNPSGKPVYAVEYYLYYNSDYFWAETQNKGPFLGEHSQTLVSQNVIDNPNGVIHYAETRTVPDGVLNPDTLATIHFTAIGAPGASSILNFSGVIIVNSMTNESYDQIYTINGTVEITDNQPPTAIGMSKHRINNVAKKYPCNTTLCSCSYDLDYHSKGGNITYVRWAFGDGQYGTSEGLPDENNCTCKEHKYESWQWAPFGVPYPDGHYVQFSAYLTVTDDGCPEESSTCNFDVTVFIAGDANGDGKVNILDGAYVGKHWNDCCCGSGCPCYPESCDPSVSICMEHLWDELQQDEADLNNDCNINILDAMIIGANWGCVAW